MKTLSLAEYIEKERNRLVAFELFWKNNQHLYPDDFLDKLPYGDWEEQHSIFDC